MTQFEKGQRIQIDISQKKMGIQQMSTGKDAQHL